VIFEALYRGGEEQQSRNQTAASFNVLGVRNLNGKSRPISPRRGFKKLARGLRFAPTLSLPKFSRETAVGILPPLRGEDVIDSSFTRKFLTCRILWAVRKMSSKR
jgi:hypothetical protein